MIRLENLSLTLGDKALISNVTLEIPAGAVAVISGESGSGKSTLLKVLIGQQSPAAGTVFIDGEPLTFETIASVRRKVVYVPQQPAALPGETGASFLEAPFLYRANRDQRPNEESIGQALAAMGLAPTLLDQEMTRLSGGERQRLALARALLLKRPLMLLDEPTSAIDEVNRARVLTALGNLPDTTILAVSHDSEVVRFADVALRLIDGGLEAGHGS